jgi:transcriptional regulator with XRE-family HTH domain
MTAEQLRARRVVARITGSMVCARAGVSRGRLSEIERGHVKPPAAELQRIEQALDQLVEARDRVAAVAVECGWPAAAL